MESIDNGIDFGDDDGQPLEEDGGDYVLRARSAQTPSPQRLQEEGG